MSIQHFFSQLNRIWNGWFIRLAKLGCYVLAAFYFTVIGLMIWKGDVWAYIFYAENPYAHLAGGLLFLLFAHILRVGHVYTARDWKMLIAKCVLLCFSMVLAFFTGEIGLRIILIKQQEAGSIQRLREMKANNQKIPIKSDHPMASIIEFSQDLDLVYELQPNMDREFGHKLLRTNSRGMRADRDYAVQKPAGVCRIAGIGDSGMFGWNVEQGEEYLAVLERNLNQRGDGITYEVLNLSVPGYNTALEVEGFVFKGLEYHPDILVVGWCENDYQLPFFMLERENFQRTDVSFLRTYLFNRKDVADVVAGRKIRSLRDFDEDLVEEEIKDNSGWNGVQVALVKLKDICEKQDIHLIVMGPLKSTIRDILDKLGIQYFNTYEKIKASDYPAEYSIHFMHPRPQGHAVIAKELEKDLDRRGWLKVKPPDQAP